MTYIRALAEAMHNDVFDAEALRSMSDEQVIAALTKVKGIGRWTAEMFLIFNLGREDVLSLGDAGLRRAAVWLYGSDEEGAPPLEELGRSWAPYRSIASLYLWEAVNRGHVDAGPAPNKF
ncbi:DNA-3-methyladenine glycosylase family protein [Paenibacillus chartarius]|uniref:DNA-3-methyladenine glycosylase II n=1 Tax=Paenibacillus chartarius TaxID=747481 RepID=A0ABV6DI40_9BACL